MGLCIQDNGEISMEKKTTITGCLKGIAEAYRIVERYELENYTDSASNPGSSSCLCD